MPDARGRHLPTARRRLHAVVSSRAPSEKAANPWVLKYHSIEGRRRPAAELDRQALSARLARNQENPSLPQGNVLVSDHGEPGSVITYATLDPGYGAA